MSTEHQQYSMEIQSALIHAYADAHGMRIIHSYQDPGRSGLTLRQRPGLSRLLADIVSGGTAFEVVLVYDVSRWGRFQDVDEGAHYEFLCRRAGIRVIYCAEQFGPDGTPFEGVLKSLKRAMAGEYSRELSVKVAAGKARIGALGFRVGGIAGYGLRRQILEHGIQPGMLLGEHQRKSIQTDRVRLVPGPAEEIALVRRIYRDYIHRRRSERQIADDLNREGLRCFGRPWSRNLVRTILSNEKYVGNNIVGQFCQRMRTPQIVKPRDQWVRCDGAFAAIVPTEVFEAAARVRGFNEKTYFSGEQVLQALRIVLKREGRLTAAVINAAAETPSANTVELRFGSLGQAYRQIGYVPAPRYRHHAVDQSLRELGQQAAAELLQQLAAAGIGCERSSSGLITCADGSSLELRVCRCHQSRPELTGWRLAYQRNLGASWLVALRMQRDNCELRDLLLVPRDALQRLPQLLRPRHEHLLAGYRSATLAQLVQALRCRIAV